MAYKLASEVANIVEAGQFASGGHVNVLLRKKVLRTHDSALDDPCGYRHPFHPRERIREVAWRVIEGSSDIAKAELFRVVPLDKLDNALDHGRLPLAVNMPGWARVEIVDVALRDHSAGSRHIVVPAAMSATVALW